METILLNELNYHDNLGICSDFLIEGEVIAFPTETVYGLGCDFFNATAVEKLFYLKGRDFNKPLSAHISDLKFVEDLSDSIPDEFFILADYFLPGPLTIVLKKSKIVPDIVTAGFNTIGIRYPDNQIALEIINHFGKPLAATSANISGQSPAIETKDIIKNFLNKIPLIVDGGLTIKQIASTVIDLSSDRFNILREGAIPKSEIEKVLKVNL